MKFRMGSAVVSTAPVGVPPRKWRHSSWRTKRYAESVAPTVGRDAEQSDRDGRARAPVRAYTQRGASPRQAERSPACNRRLLRRGDTRWEAAGGEQPVRNSVTCRT